VTCGADVVAHDTRAEVVPCAKDELVFEAVSGVESAGIGLRSVY
jgi:hypothetical protein